MPHGQNQVRAARWLRQLVVGGADLGPQRPPLHLVPQEAAPTNPSEGSIYFSSVTKSLHVHNGTGWVALSAATTRAEDARTPTGGA